MFNNIREVKGIILRKSINFIVYTWWPIMKNYFNQYWVESSYYYSVIITIMWIIIIIILNKFIFPLVMIFIDKYIIIVLKYIIGFATVFKGVIILIDINTKIVWIYLITFREIIGINLRKSINFIVH